MDSLIHKRSKMEEQEKEEEQEEVPRRQWLLQRGNDLSGDHIYMKTHSFDMSFTNASNRLRSNSNP